MARNRYYQGPPSDHFDGTQFFYPGHATDRGFRDILRWRMTSNAAAWPEQVTITPSKPQMRSQALRVTMVGHATLLIQLDGMNVLTDPVWSLRASPLTFAGPKRVMAPGIAFEDLPPIDLVLLSHNHYDHLDIATLKRLHARDRPRILTPLGNDTIVRRAIAGADCVPMDWQAQAPFQDSTVTLVPALHWSARGLGDRRHALWGGFMLRTKQALVYFAGDTGYGDGALFRRLFAEHGAPDLALIPVGAYAPRWFMRAQHTDPEEAVQIMLDLQAKQAVAIHWGCFQLTDEPREEPIERLRAALQAQAIAPSQFAVLMPGETLSPPAG